MASLSLQAPPAVHFIICPRRTTGPSKSPNTSSTRKAPATRDPRCDFEPDRYRSAVVTALFSFVVVSHDRSTPTSKRHPSVRLLFAGLQKDRDKVTPAAML